MGARERNLSFRTIDDFNVVSAMPIISFGDGRFFMLEQFTVEQSLYESPFFWMRDDVPGLRNAVRQRYVQLDLDLINGGCRWSRRRDRANRCRHKCTTLAECCSG
jgi:hypothetical protein